MGYPVLNIEKISNTKLRITQERFLKDRNAKDTTKSPFDYKWDVPITMISDKKNETSLHWLNR